ncbi:MAG: hypothetical protein LBK03_05155 [Bacteroidales bacterium]|jgi:hypothetical protein|nr:hypothetical protein [Bacteroidales bacterium]
MKKTLLITVFYCMLCAYSAAQNETAAEDFDIPVKSKKILLIGEEHHTFEIEDAEKRIVKDIIRQNRDIKHYQLCLEAPFSLQYHIENLIEYNDTLSVKQYFSCVGTGIAKLDTLTPSKKETYRSMLYYAQMAKSMQSGSLQIRCIDVEAPLHPAVFTILHILRKYEIRDSLFQKQFNYLDSLFSLNHLLYHFAPFHERFGNYFLSHKDFFQHRLSPRDYYYISEIIGRCPKKVVRKSTFEDAIVTQERDIIMYNAINQHYNDSTFYIAILGRSHVLRKGTGFERKFHGKFKNVATLLATDKDSHFKRRINSLVFCSLSRYKRSINPKGEVELFNPQSNYPGHFAKHKDYLNSMLTPDNITFLNLRKTRLRNARCYADYMIVMKQVTGIY